MAEKDTDLEDLDMGQFTSWFQSVAAKEQVMHLSIGGRQWDVSWNHFPTGDDAQ